MFSILIIEDEAPLRIALRNHLEIYGYEVDVAGDAKSGLETFVKGHPDLVILDFGLAQSVSFKLLKALRGQDSTTPILILIDGRAEADRDWALRTGADSYLTKPVSLVKLSAQANFLLCASSRRAVPIQRFGFIEIDLRAMIVRRRSAEVHLAPKEFTLLLALVRARGKTLSRFDLLAQVWGHTTRTKRTLDARTVDSNIASLRKKLEESPSAPRHIVTVRCIGYCFKP